MFSAQKAEHYVSSVGIACEFLDTSSGKLFDFALEALLGTASFTGYLISDLPETNGSRTSRDYVL